jgi:fatty acid desaturase
MRRDEAELSRLRRQIEQAPPDAEPTPAPAQTEGRLGRILDVFLFLVGAALVFDFIVSEFGWHWLIALLAAPVGGAVTVMLRRAGAVV